MKIKAPVLHAVKTRQVVEELDIEEPQEGEVMVRMVASGVCHSCLHALDGSWEGTLTPIVLGDEGSGIIERVGPGVSHLKPGDHVVLSWAPTCGKCYYCASGRPVICEDRPGRGVLYDGRSRIKLSDGTMVYQYGTVASNAQYSVVPESCAIKIRDDMPLDRAALIGCSVMTGVGAVLNTARVPAGKSLAVFGTGGIGLNAIQGGRIANAYPLIAVDVADNKLEYAHEMGATHTINGSRQNVQEEITRITGRGVEYAIVAVGSSKAIEQAWSCLARGGTCVVVGMPSTGDTFSLDVRGTLVGMERRLVGSSYGSAQTRIDFPRMVDLYMTGKLKIDELVTRRFKMEEANEAYDALARGELARGLILFD